MNRRRAKAIAWAVTLLMRLTATASAQARVAPAPGEAAVITGRILDKVSLIGLPGVEIRFLEGPGTTVTDSAGDFRVETLAQGSVILVLRKLGYAQVGVPLDVRDGDSLHVATTMTRISQDLDTVRVVGRSEALAAPRLAGFERRRLLHRGTFFTREQLERTPSVSIGDVLRGIPSIRVREDQPGMLTIESTRGLRLDRDGRPVPCRIRVMVDGFLMPFGTPMPVASPKQLHGIEVYSGPATIPRELAPNGEDAFCGLVAMWTK